MSIYNSYLLIWYSYFLFIATIPVSLGGKGAIWLELSNLTLETHLKTHADWSVLRRILDTESELGMRQLSSSERELQVEFFGRELQPRQSVEVRFRTRNEYGLILTTSDDENYSILEVTVHRYLHLTTRALFIVFVLNLGVR